MSYARFSEDSNVYVFFSVGDFLDCCGCALQSREWVEEGQYFRCVDPIIETTFKTTQGMVDHLALHVAAGHKVPDYLVGDLWADDAENFPPTCGGCGPTPSAHRCPSCVKADVREDRANDERTWS